MENLVGQTLGGRYEVREVIGTGGMAIVYKAYCTVLHRYVAIKVLKEEFSQDEEFRKRFYNEAQAVAKLSQNNIVSIYDVCHTENCPEYIVMELCEGVTLKDYLRKKHHLTWQETLYFAQQVARALDHAHSRGIIHQDIKPQNIMLLRDGTAKVMDFGIASFANSQETRKVSSEAIGSVHYISPEQAKGIKVDFRTDLYSLGVVMYEMLTGTLPFRGDTAVAVVMQHLNTVPPVPSSIVPDIPKAMDEIVMHAMCANANQRYSSAMDMFRDMERLRSNPNLVLNYSSHNSDLDETRAISYNRDEDATQYIPHTPAVEADEDATQYVPRATESQSRPQQQQTNKRTQRPAEDDDNEVYEAPVKQRSTGSKKKGGTGKVVAGAVIVVLIAVVAFFAMRMAGNSNNETQTLNVPQFVGLNYTKDIKGNKDYSDFNFQITEQEFTQDEADSKGYADGDVIDQNPRAKTTIDVGTEVALTLASVVDNTEEEPNTVSVPSLAGKSYEDAQSALRAKGLKAKRTEKTSESVAQGYVISSDPDAGEDVEVGSTVTVVVSSGSANTNKTVPNLRGLTTEQASAALEKAGLALGSVHEQESTATAGTVISQTVPYGTEVAKGTSVGITIAKEQATDEQPTNGNGDTDNNGDTNNGDTDNGDGNTGGTGSASVSVTSSRISVSLPTDRDTCSVTISVGGSTLYSSTAKTSRGSVGCSVRYTSTQRVVVTVDGSTVYDQDVDFSKL